MIDLTIDLILKTLMKKCKLLVVDEFFILSVLDVWPLVVLSYHVGGALAWLICLVVSSPIPF